MIYHCILGQYISAQYSKYSKVGAKYSKQMTDIVECVMSLITVNLLIM